MNTPVCRGVCIGCILSLALLSGCARFNTYYNAEQYFKQAEKNRKKATSGQVSAADIDLYDKAIQKASKVLTFYPNSKLVDDALLLVGRSYYGKGEYLKAARKFTELIDNFPRSELVYEASFWRGTCYYAVKNYQRAEQSLAAIVTQKGAKKWAAEAQFLLAEMAYNDKRYGYAISEYRKVVSRFPGSVRSAEAQYRIGQCLTILNRPSEARIAFEKVFEFSPHDSIELNAKFSVGQSLREDGKFDESISIFKNLLKDSRNIDYYSAIRLEIAECKAEKGDLEDAISDYEEIIKEYPRTEGSAEAHHRLGLIYLNTVGDQTKAKEHFDAVKTEYAKSAFSEEAQRIGKNIDSLTKLYNKLNPPPVDSTDAGPGTGLDTGPVEGELPALTLDEVISEMLSGHIRMDGQEETVEEESQPPDSSQVAQQQKPPPAKPVSVDTAEVHFKLAELYLFQFTAADSALRHYDEVARRFPESDYAAKSAFAIAWMTDIILNDPLAAQEAYLRVIRDFPGTSYDDAARFALGETLPRDDEFSASFDHFSQAEEQLFRGGDLDSLVSAYQTVIDQYPESPYAAKAGYAIAWMTEYIKSDRQQATQAYQAILDTYADSEYARQAKLKLGLEKPPTTPKAAAPHQQQQQPTVKQDEDTDRELTLEEIVADLSLEGTIDVSEPDLGIPLQP